MAVEATRKKRPEITHVMLVSHTFAFFLWPLWFLPLCIWSYGEFSTLNLETAGWLYTVALGLFIVMMVYDVGFKELLIIGLVLLIFFFATKWYQLEASFLIFDPIFKFFADLDLRYDGSYAIAARLLGAFSFILWVVDIIYSWLNHRYRLEPNELVLVQFGRRWKSQGTVARRYNISFEDYLEAIVGIGSGTILFRPIGHSMLRLRYVPFLFFKQGRINRLLSTRQVTTEAEQELLHEAVEEADSL